ncbi:hypothetical protein CMUS01_09078 [Colletotrichum musicola]|uniref:Uncharacterized protein n=1 Tax=Colletotrichum musicola TaxID=2175873 RepID=A0A8H6K9N3_9PEZI|nr:hypothetical protein CMUS01_09078 [Colletotrichum musicola]
MRFLHNTLEPPGSLGPSPPENPRQHNTFVNDDTSPRVYYVRQLVRRFPATLPSKVASHHPLSHLNFLAWSGARVIPDPSEPPPPYPGLLYAKPPPEPTRFLIPPSHLPGGDSGGSHHTCPEPELLHIRASITVWRHAPSFKQPVARSNTEQTNRSRE